MKRQMRRARVILALAFSVGYMFLGLQAWAETSQVPDREVHAYTNDIYGSFQVVRTMANTPGRHGAYFKTKVVIHNPTRQDYNLWAKVCDTKRCIPLPPKGYYQENLVSSWTAIRMRPQSYVVFENFLEEAFDYPIKGAGAVVFEGAHPGTGSRSGTYLFSVSAWVYTDSPSGRYSTLVTSGASGDLGDIDLGANQYSFGTRVVNMGVTSNDNQRVNIGLFSWTDGERIYDAYVHNNKGELVETVTFHLHQYGWQQKAVKSQIEGGYIRWGCRFSRCDAFPWVVEVNNQSNDGVLRRPVRYRGAPQ